MLPKKFTVWHDLRKNFNVYLNFSPCSRWLCGKMTFFSVESQIRLPYFSALKSDLKCTLRTDSPKGIEKILDIQDARDLLLMCVHKIPEMALGGCCGCMGVAEQIKRSLQPHTLDRNLHQAAGPQAVPSR